MVDLYTVTEKKEDIDPNLNISIGDDVGIREWINRGYLVLRSSVEYYHKKHPGSPLYIVERKDNIFHSWKDSIDEFNRRKEEKRAEKERRSNMTEYQLCREDNAIHLKKCGLSDEEISECLNLIDENDSLPDMEDIDIRRFGNEVQWKYRSKWEKLIELNRPEEEKHSEKYYANIYHVWDMDIVFSITSVCIDFPNQYIHKIVQLINNKHYLVFYKVSFSTPECSHNLSALSFEFPGTKQRFLSVLLPE